MTRNAAATAEFSNRPALLQETEADAGAQEQSRTARIEVQPSRHLLGGAGALGQDVEDPSRFAVRSVWLSQYAVLSRTIEEGSGTLQPDARVSRS